MGLDDYKKEAAEVRKTVLKLIHHGGTSHIASCFSCVDIAVVLYRNLKEHDEVVWSAGWKAALEYTMLWKQGKITEEQLNSFPNPPFLGLAETTVPGVLCNGGSVGHGLPIACGMALGKKRAGEKGTIYCIMSDGELNEGSVWEAVMFAAHHKLDNLVAIIDKNGWQAMGKTGDVLNLNHWPGGCVTNKWVSFGWYPLECNGHNFESIKRMIFLTASIPTKPRIVIAHTVKGKGVSFMENHLLYHYAHVDKETYEKALAELNA